MMITHNHSLPMLLAGMLVDPSGLTDDTVTGISLDSREIKAGNVFLSLAKDDEQRINNLKQALAAKSSVILVDAKQTLTQQEHALLIQAKVNCHSIKNLADKAGEIAARFYGHPSLALTVIAVTGTNGKTSVSQFIAQGLESLGHACGVIGTLGVGRINNLQHTGMTTPDPVSMQKILANFCQQDIQYVVIEASSHALDQGRLNSITVDVAALTNLSRDHLDYHSDMASYSAAKSRLFDFSSVKTAVLNSRDSLGQSLIKVLEQRNNVDVLSYAHSDSENTDLQANTIQMTREGMNFTLHSTFGTEQIQTSLIGEFNIDNLLATFACLLAVDISYEDAISALAQCRSVNGRMQRIADNKHAQVVIDFAHTPDALTQALISLQAHVSANGDVWCVFGCGGDRDIGKRALMGKAAEHYADKIVITDDNPRSEDSSSIVNDILSGMDHPEVVTVEADRKLAIAHAITHASATDIVLIAGKGHEEYQEIKGVKYTFSDRQVAEAILSAANDGMPFSTGDIA
ncbi:MAG: UDP-N-acetylmuramoyl-L-alanyl-D-glutamate--2,6-diaminopimelate ligase [Gammaproteobacteria bacterium]|nr:UDP-N-acetylmuramoyl-L-alanyl-D-glutamate--2,6-diaminopimelate ligase [Gammaproteobacteria bacterium]